jgi:3-phytase
MRKHAGAALALLGLAACATQNVELGANVPALRETAAVNMTGDAADDPAIWVAPNAADSVMIGTQKEGALYVFDLSGAVVQEVPGGLPNNVDLRDGFVFNDGTGVLVGASDRQARPDAARAHRHRPSLDLRLLHGPHGR